jgi:hypothetical protein
MDKQLKEFIRVKNGIMPKEQKEKGIRLYTLLKKGYPVPGYIDKPYTLIRWKKRSMELKGEARKIDLSIREKIV